MTSKTIHIGNIRSKTAMESLQEITGTDHIGFVGDWNSDSRELKYTCTCGDSEIIKESKYFVSERSQRVKCNGCGTNQLFFVGKNTPHGKLGSESAEERELLKIHAEVIAESEELCIISVSYLTAEIDTKWESAIFHYTGPDSQMGMFIIVDKIKKTFTQIIGRLPIMGKHEDMYKKGMLHVTDSEECRELANVLIRINSLITDEKEDYCIKMFTYELHETYADVNGLFTLFDIFSRLVPGFKDMLHHYHGEYVMVNEVIMDAYALYRHPIYKDIKENAPMEMGLGLCYNTMPTNKADEFFGKLETLGIDTQKHTIEEATGIPWDVFGREMDYESSMIMSVFVKKLKKHNLFDYAKENNMFEEYPNASLAEKIEQIINKSGQDFETIIRFYCRTIHQLGNEEAEGHFFNELWRTDGIIDLMPEIINWKHGIDGKTAKKFGILLHGREITKEQYEKIEEKPTMDNFMKTIS